VLLKTIPYELMMKLKLIQYNPLLWYFRRNNPRRFKDEKVSIPLSTTLNYRKNRKERVQIGLENLAKFKDST
jgi:hypothetical protein